MKTDLALYFPPHCESALDGPHLALPQLKAYLERDGFKVSTTDLNIGYFRWATEPVNLLPKLHNAVEVAHRLQAERVIDGRQANSLAIGALARRILAALEQLGDDTILPDHLFREAVSFVSEHLYWVPTALDEAISSVLASDKSPFDAYFEQIALRPVESRVIGISVAFHLQLYPALLLARKLRKFTKVPVILGGSQISLMASHQQRRLAELPFVSGLILHEGELPLQTLLRQAETDFSQVPNTLYVHEGRLCKTAWHDPPAMDSLPTPEFVAEELRLYIGEPILPLYVSKGCYWGRCKFCDYTKLYTPGQANSEGWSTFRSPHVISEDISRLQRMHGATSFYLVSEAVSPSYYRRLASTVIARRLRVNLSSYCRVEKRLDFPFFRQLRAAGVRVLTFGVESPNDRILALIDKGNAKKDIERTIRAASSAGIRVVFNMIPDYPTTTFQEAVEAIRFVQENVDFIDVVNAQFFDLSVNSVIANEQQLHGIKVVADTPISTNHGVHSVHFERMSGMSQSEVQALKRIYGRLYGAVLSHARDSRNTLMLSHPSFDWPRARFLFTEDVDIIYAEFDQIGERFHLADAEKGWITLSNRRLRRLLRAPLLVESLLETGKRLGACSLEDIFRDVALTHDIRDHANAVSLIKSCISSMAKTGFVERIMHPMFPELPDDRDRQT